MSSDINFIPNQHNDAKHDRGIEPNFALYTSIHEGVFDDIPVRYQTCQYQSSCYDRLVFLDKDLKNSKGIDLLNKVKASQLVRANSPITFKRSKGGCLFIDFNFSESQAIQSRGE